MATAEGGEVRPVTPVGPESGVSPTGGGEGMGLSDEVVQIGAEVGHRPFQSRLSSHNHILSEVSR